MLLKVSAVSSLLLQYIASSVKGSLPRWLLPCYKNCWMNLNIKTYLMWNKSVLQALICEKCITYLKWFTAQIHFPHFFPEISECSFFTIFLLMTQWNEQKLTYFCPSFTDNLTVDSPFFTYNPWMWVFPFLFYSSPPQKKNRLFHQIHIYQRDKGQLTCFNPYICIAHLFNSYVEWCLSSTHTCRLSKYTCSTESAYYIDKGLTGIQMKMRKELLNTRKP